MGAPDFKPSFEALSTISIERLGSFIQAPEPPRPVRGARKNALVPRAAPKAAGGMELGEGRASGWLKTGSLWVVEGK